MTDRSHAEVAKEIYGVKTVHAYPPIPIRSMDWMAFYEGDEEEGPRGFGGTEREAVQDLLDNWPREARKGEGND